MQSESLNKELGCSLFFKCENFQKMGAFKSRGAMNAVLSMKESELQNGVCTHSSGNHAQAIARAAFLVNTKAYIVMPHTAPEVKKKGVQLFNAKIIECEPTLQARESTLADIVAQTGACEIHPYNNFKIIEGQSTAAIEVYETIPKIEAIVAPVGGGGLLSGTLLATNFFSSQTVVYGAEPSGSDDAFRSLLSGKIEKPQSKTIADGLLTMLGTKTFPIIRDHVKEIITVSDSEILESLQIIFERLKIVVEPSGGVPLAVVRKRPDLFVKKRVTVILSGGNVDVRTLWELFRNLKK